AVGSEQTRHPEPVRFRASAVGQAQGQGGPLRDRGIAGELVDVDVLAQTRAALVEVRALVEVQLRAVVVDLTGEVSAIAGGCRPAATLRKSTDRDDLDEAAPGVAVARGGGLGARHRLRGLGQQPELADTLAAAPVEARTAGVDQYRRLVRAAEHRWRQQ